MFWYEVRNRSHVSTELWLRGYDELLVLCRRQGQRAATCCDPMNTPCTDGRPLGECEAVVHALR